MATSKESFCASHSASSAVVGAALNAAIIALPKLSQSLLPSASSLTVSVRGPISPVSGSLAGGASAGLAMASGATAATTGAVGGTGASVAVSAWAISSAV